MAKLTQENMSVMKTMQLIESLARANEPMRLTDLSAETGIPSSTALRMLHTLVQCGYVYHEEKGLQRYGLTMRFMQIAQSSTDHFNIQSVVHPFLLELSHDADESCCVSVEDCGRVRYVDVVENQHKSFVVRQRIGNTASMHNTGSGKVFLSQYTREMFDEYVNKNGLPAVTKKTNTTSEALWKDVQRGKREGYFFDNEEAEIGIRCVAVPILGIDGKPMAALSVSSATSRMSYDRSHKVIIPLLLKCARKITNQICGERSSDEEEDTKD